MKNKTILFIIIILLFGCNDDILDNTPLDRISGSSVWADKDLIQSYVNAQYNVIQSGFDNLLMYYTDEAYSQYVTDSWGWRNNTITPWSVEYMLSGQLNFWSSAYSYIHNINLFFENFDESQFSEDVVNSLTGEIRFLRAYIYSTLLWSYGEVPIIKESFDLEDDLTGVTRDSYDDVLNLILDDLEYVIDVMPARQTGDDLGRASGDVAKALKSRLLLYDASVLNNPSNDVTKWQRAADAAEALLDAGYSLYQDYGDLFLIDDNSEIIWQKYYTPESGNGFAFQSAPISHGGWGLFQPTQNLVDDYEMANGELPYLPDGSINPASGFNPDSFWVNRDPRFYEVVSYLGSDFQGEEVTLVYTTQDLTSGYYNRKFVDPSFVIANTNNYTTPWIHFRLAEIYLNYAEAQYQLGNEDVAREYVNKVRARVNMPGIEDEGTELLERIRHERRIELAYEGHRYYDIRRWEIAPQTQNIPIIGNVVSQRQDGAYEYTPGVLLDGFWDDKFYYTPIPYDDIQKSGGSLIQNPGWE